VRGRVIHDGKAPDIQRDVGIGVDPWRERRLIEPSTMRKAAE
jgi:hypothetical protein